MSSILKTSAKYESQGAINKYHVTIKVIVHSHNAKRASNGSKQELIISDDVVSCSLSKNIKGAGQAALEVLATKNYLNEIFPNDYINIYFNVGDGQGWTRTFFGLIDRIEESYSVGDTGIPSTQYSISCTDFTKIFAKTDIYFNPHINQRRDLNGLPFGSLNVGGLALMTQGIPISGSPDSIVTTTIILLLGFGSQFMMPDCYPTPEALIKEAQTARQNAALRRIQGKLAGVNYSQQKQQATEAGRVEATRLFGADTSSSEISTYIQATYGIAAEQDFIARAISSKDVDALGSAISDKILATSLGMDAGLGSAFNTFLAIDRTATNSPATFLDYMDLFTFVEREAMDGFTSTETILSSSGPILSILTQFSNEMVNELYFDLRPRHNADKTPATQFTQQSYARTSEDDWDRSTDDLGHNLNHGGHSSNDVNGIKYVPALVMREYPFSTISTLDASEVPVSVSTTRGGIQENRGAAGSGTDRTHATQETTSNENQTLGDLFLGAVFSDGPNLPGRHYIYTPNMNVEDLATNSPVQTGRRILDVAVISEQEIKSSTFGRSDEDHVNLIEIISDSPLGDDAKWFMVDLSPIASPIQIMRNGLRKRTLTTLFTRYNRASTQNTTRRPVVVQSRVPQAHVAPGTPTIEQTVSVDAGGRQNSAVGANDDTIAENAADTAATGFDPNSPERVHAIPTADPATTHEAIVPPLGVAPAGSVVYPVDLVVNGVPVKPAPTTGTASFNYRAIRDNTDQNYFKVPAQGGELLTTQVEVTETVPANGRTPATTRKKMVTVPMNPSNTPTIPEGAEIPLKYYAFHYGIDIAAPETTNVHAAMDGEVVLIGLAGMYKDYGNCVVIKHNVAGRTVYTSYCHLHAIDARFVEPVNRLISANSIGPTQRQNNKHFGISPQGGTGVTFNAGRRTGLYTSIPVTAGQFIGQVGFTKGIDRHGKIEKFSTGPHLHFEYCSVWPPKKDSLTPYYNGNMSIDAPELTAWRSKLLRAADPVVGLNLKTCRHVKDLPHG